MRSIKQIENLADIENLLLDLGYVRYTGTRSFVRSLQSGYHIIEPELYEYVPAIIYELVLISPLWENPDKEALRRLFAAWEQFRDDLNGKIVRWMPDVIQKLKYAENLISKKKKNGSSKSTNPLQNPHKEERKGIG